jgi:hypothetical protein
VRRWVFAALVPVLGACSFILTGDGLVGDGPPDGGGDESTDSPSETSSSGGEGGCTQTVTDSKNCGRCGHDCLGGSCVSSKCQPGVVVDSQPGVFGVAITKDEVFWSTPDGLISKKPRAGGAVQVIATSQVNPQHVTTTLTHVYWASEGTGTIRRAPLDGGTVETALDSLSAPTGVSLAADRIYWTELDGGLGLFNADAGTRTYYFSGLPGLGDIDTVANSTTGDAIYWAGAAEGPFPSGIYRRSGLAGGAGNSIEAPTPVGLSIVESVFYFSTPSTGEISKGTDGKPREVIVSGQDKPMGVAADSTAVYWAEMGKGRVMVLAL